MKENIVSQIRYMWSVSGKIWSWLIKNWLTMGTTFSMAAGAYTVASPYLDQKAEKYGSRVLAPSFKLLQERQDSAHFAIKLSQDSMYIDIKESIRNIEGSKTDTVLIRMIANESFQVVIDEMPREFEKLWTGKMEALQVDTVWEINPNTGKTLGFFTYSVDALGRIVRYTH